MTLTELFQLHGRAAYYTDKGDGHTYLPEYDKLFKGYRDKPINIFEIGHSAGGGLRLFDDYFTHPETRIVGIDLSDDDWKQIYYGHPYGTERVKTYIKDVRSLCREWFDEINFIPDIVIDDSDHVLETQLWIVRNILPIIRKGGLLIIEDIAYPDKRKDEFEKLGIPFELIDMNNIRYTADNALIIYRT